jgi:hypothetical protein
MVPNPVMDVGHASAQTHQYREAPPMGHAPSSASGASTKTGMMGTPKRHPASS